MEDLPSLASLHSSTDEEPSPSNRRSSERHLTLFRVGSLILGEQRHLCLVKNVSSRGALIRAYCGMREGQAASIELREQQPIDGRVSWIRGTEAGLEFVSEIDVLDLLKVGGTGPRPRMPRIDVQSSGTVRQGAIVYRMVVNNISQGGLSLQCGADLTVGGEVTIMLSALEAQKAVIRWSRSGAYGITFNEVIGLPRLVEWLQMQTGAGRA